MQKTYIDLSDRVSAEASKNKTALVGIIIMDIVLCIAYLVEVFKDSRSVPSYVFLCSACIVPWIIAKIVHKVKKDSVAIRYILGIGFMVFYAYIMFTSSTDMAFCYVLVVYSILIVYVDFKFSILVGSTAFAINVALLIKQYITEGLSPEQITNAEIMLACIILTCLFAVLSTKKVNQISQANIDRADMEKEQSEILLQTTLGVAATITENIEVAVQETEHLNMSIDATQRSMTNLSNGTNDTMQAIVDQQRNTNEIADHINGVENVTDQIVGELAATEKNLNEGHEMMTALIDQVKVSEESSGIAAREMEGLRENADKMQNIVGLISNVANQTALLSLNASIEAARAGEAGRGFSVVASEISNLAAQTNGATSDINKLIENITNSIKEVTRAVEGLLESNQQQNECVGRTAENFEKIHNSTRIIFEHAEQLKHTVEAASTANMQVVESINNVSAMTQKVTAGANETLHSCNDNLISIEKVMSIMEILDSEARKLQSK